MSALGVAGADKGGVDDEQDPGTSLPENGGRKHADPERQLQLADNGHGELVIALNEGADPVGQGVGFVLRLGAGGGARGRGDLLRRADGRDQVGAGVGGDVEDRVDGVGQQGQRVLRGEEPDEGHDCGEGRRLERRNKRSHAAMGRSWGAH